MSLVYTPNRPRMHRLDVNVATASMLADIHRAAELPLSGDDEDILMPADDRAILQKSRLRSNRVPYKASKAQTQAWGEKLADFRPMDTQALESLRREWVSFLLRCDGYVAQ